MAYSIAIWSNTPDTWRSDTLLSPPKKQLFLLQDSGGSTISFNDDGWVDTGLTSVDANSFKDFGVDLSKISSIDANAWQRLYDSFLEPFSVHLFRKQDEQSSNELVTTISNNKNVTEVVEHSYLSEYDSQITLPTDGEVGNLYTIPIDIVVGDRDVVSVKDIDIAEI